MVTASCQLMGILFSPPFEPVEESVLKGSEFDLFVCNPGGFDRYVSCGSLVKLLSAIFLNIEL